MGMSPIYYKANTVTNSLLHPHLHLCDQRISVASSLNICMLYNCERKLEHQEKPTQTQGEHANSAQKDCSQLQPSWYQGRYSLKSVHWIWTGSDLPHIKVLTCLISMTDIISLNTGHNPLRFHFILETSFIYQVPVDFQTAGILNIYIF